MKRIPIIKMLSKNKINIFLSVGNPHKKDQARFIRNFSQILQRRNLEIKTLGVSDYSLTFPLKPIKELINKCHGVIILGMERTFIRSGCDKRNSKNQNIFKNRIISTSWNQLEAGMAYQKGLPIIVMKEKEVHPDGIFDPKLSGYYVADLTLNNPRTFSGSELKLIDKWHEEVIKYYKKRK